MYGGLISALAFDRSSVRSYDRDGRLHVASTNISKAAVNPYLGREIPDWEKLGLDPNKMYKLLRDPEELAKAAPTFNNLPLLSRHVAVTADAHAPELVIGSTGTDSDFSHPYLGNSLVIWAKSGIDAVESEAQKELSSAYRYRADMTPGVYDGERYDGVMRDIVGNHVAIVKEGRAGSDVVVGDSNEEIAAMSKKVLLSRTALLTLGTMAAAVAPLMAQDQKLPDMVPIVADVTTKNFKESKPKVLAALTKALEGKLAKDASIEGVAKLLDALEGGAKDEDEPVDPEMIGIAPEEAATDDDPLAKLKEFLKAKLGPEDMAQVEALCGAGGAMDNPPPFTGMPKPGGAKDAFPPKKDDDKKEDEKMDKPAMDAAIKTAVAASVAEQRAIREAEKVARPYVGEIAIAFDSAEQVYRHTLKALGVKGVDAVHASALRTILEMQPAPGSKPSKAPKLASDEAAAGKGFADRWKNLGNIQVG